jgi:hypothetical protein
VIQLFFTAVAVVFTKGQSLNIKSLTNENLESHLQKLVKTERKITHLVLQCIAEIDRRKLYLLKAYPSLFEFLVQSYGYSPSAAMRRIDGARLLQQIPEVAEKIESGAVNLSQVSLIQRAEREVKRETKCAMPLEVKRELLFKIENRTQIQTEQLIAKTLNVDLSPAKRTVHHRDESVTLTITLNKEQMKILEAVQAKLSHAVPEKNWSSLIAYLAQKELSRLNGKQKSTNAIAHKAHPTVRALTTEVNKKPENKSEIQPKEPNFYPQNKSKTESAIDTDFTAATVADRSAQHLTLVGKAHRPSIPRSIQRQLLHPNAVCVFRDPSTGKICGSRHFLQMDHIKSVSRGGRNEISNLQVLCGQHNRYKYAVENRI